MPRKKKCKPPTIRGNILFLILLAVVLFAALSYAVTGALRGGGKDASSEKVGLFVSQLLENATMLEHAMSRAMLMDNVPEYGFDLNGRFTASTANNNCTRPACKMFDLANGGGVISFATPKWASTENSPPHTDFVTVSVMHIGTDAQDVVYRRKGLTKDVCEEVNKRVGAIINIPDAWESYGSSGNYSGTLSTFPNSSGLLGDQQTSLRGKKTFCFNHSYDGYTFIAVIMER